ncbi:acetyl esterase [Pacificibacter maritimus]|uniref:Acetyl esterase n=1 Tax=Pacificibacter maritimus TaxID=762213 RepID=A0A3N4VGV3_9RHOB|nr:alpha/beta hydrolase [Pacificibacter maritimus]RPE72164.1 acetyl esterase [Pacificibacter maritimus]
MKLPSHLRDHYATLDPDVREILEWNAQNAAPHNASVAELRRRHTEMAAVFDVVPAHVASTTDHTVPNTRQPASIRIYDPVETCTGGDGAAIFFAHGGAWVVGNVESHDNLCRQICAATGVKVISADYGMAPENPFPHQTQDCICIYDWVLSKAADFGIKPEKIILCGDSSGANLVTVLSHELKGRHGDMPIGQVLIYPSVALSKHRDYPSWKTYPTGYLIGEASLARTIEHYLRNEADLTDPRVSPLLFEDFSGLPPALVITAEHDPIRDGGREYAEKLISAGVETHFLECPGTIHGFMTYGKPWTEIERALRQITTFVQQSCLT